MRICWNSHRFRSKSTANYDPHVTSSFASASGKLDLAAPLMALEDEVRLAASAPSGVGVINPVQATRTGDSSASSGSSRVRTVRNQISIGV